MKKTNRTEDGKGAVFFILFYVLFCVLIVCAFCNTIKLGIIAFVLYTIVCLEMLYYFLREQPKSKDKTKRLLIAFLCAEAIGVVPCAIILIIKGLFF